MKGIVVIHEDLMIFFFICRDIDIGAGGPLPGETKKISVKSPDTEHDKSRF